MPIEFGITLNSDILLTAQQESKCECLSLESGFSRQSDLEKDETGKAHQIKFKNFFALITQFFLQPLNSKSHDLFYYTASFKRPVRHSVYERFYSFGVWKSQASPK